MKTILFLIPQLLFSSLVFSEVTAIYNKDKVEISWTNPIHVKIDLFIIERSRNGHSFKEIMKITGPRNTSELIEYYEIDDNPFKSKSYYRIKQIDINGKKYYTNIAVAENFNIIKPIFNLFSNSSKLKNIKGYNKEDVLVVLIDSKNNEYVAKVDITEINKRLIISKSNIVLPTGTYLVTGTSDDIIYGKKIICEGNYATPSYTHN
jgi:hypothetical protein